MYKINLHDDAGKLIIFEDSITVVPGFYDAGYNPINDAMNNDFVRVFNKYCAGKAELLNNQMIGVAMKMPRPLDNVTGSALAGLV